MDDLNLTSIRSNLAAVRQSVAGWQGQAELLKGQQRIHQQRRDELEATIGIKTQAQTILQQLEGTWRTKYEAGLAALGSWGLNAIFTQAQYEVVLESTIKRGAASMDIALKKDGQRVRLKGGSGGSVVQVLAYLLRHLMTTSQPSGWRLLEVLDEPFSQVQDEQRPALCEMVKEITRRLGFQFIFTSHGAELLEIADVAYRVEAGGVVTRLKSREENRS